LPDTLSTISFLNPDENFVDEEVEKIKRLLVMTLLSLLFVSGAMAEDIRLSRGMC
jgi:hypothetical protein